MMHGATCVCWLFWPRTGNVAVKVWGPREQKMLKGHLPRVIYHRAYQYTKKNDRLALVCPAALATRAPGETTSRVRMRRAHNLLACKLTTCHSTSERTEKNFEGFKDLCLNAREGCEDLYLMPRPEAGLDCRIRAIFARQHLALSVVSPLERHPVEYQGFVLPRIQGVD